MEAPLNDRLERYAELAVRVGLDVQPGQRVLVSAPVEAAPLVRAAARAAYQAGAELVNVLYADNAVTLARLQHAKRETLEVYPDWLARAHLDAGERGDAFLSITSPDPDVFAGVDPAAVASMTRAASARIRPYSEKRSQHVVPWSIIAAANPVWARKVFPDLPEAEAVARLWDEVLRVVGADEPDPAAAWRARMSRLNAAKERLSERAYTALRFSGPGTDLTVGLPEGHSWEGAGATLPDGRTFYPNVPTDEVFTMPHKDRVDGIVASTMPVVISGKVVEGIRMTFERGRVVHFTAEKGEEVIREVLGTDEGARRLGEVALVPVSSPVARSGRTFFNTLFDENASCHIAVGNSYPTTLRGGVHMSREELSARGANHSLTHVDWMIGSARVDVDGVLADGSTEPVMRSGEFAWE